MEGEGRGKDEGHGEKGRDNCCCPKHAQLLSAPVIRVRATVRVQKVQLRPIHTGSRNRILCIRKQKLPLPDTRYPDAGTSVDRLLQTVTEDIVIFAVLVCSVH